SRGGGEMPLGPTHPWERAVQTVVEATPPLVEHAYHRIAGESGIDRARVGKQELLDYWWARLYGKSAGRTPDPATLVELYQRAGEDELKDLIAALKQREQEQAHGVPQSMIPEEGAPGGRPEVPATHSY